MIQEEDILVKFDARPVFIELLNGVLFKHSLNWQTLAI